MTSPPPPPPDGQVLTRALLTGILLLAAVPVAAEWLRGDTAKWLSQLLTLLASGWLLWNIEKGSVLAWRVGSAMSIVLGMLAVFAGLLGVSWIIVVVGLAFMLCGLLLVGAPQVRAYLDGRWQSWRKAP